MIFTPSNILSVLGIMGIIFGSYRGAIAIYKRITSPQTDADKRDALLAQELQFRSDSNDLRFKAIQESFQSLLTQQNNHIHTIETKVDANTSATNALAIEVAKLHTMIDERVPRKVL